MAFQIQYLTCFSVLASVAFTTTLATSASASANVSGSAEAVTLVAQNASIEEVLATLTHEFNLHYRSSANLNKRISGRYQGSLRGVLVRVLEGYSFVMKYDGGHIEVKVLDESSNPSRSLPITTAGANSSLTNQQQNPLPDPRMFLHLDR